MRKRVLLAVTGTVASVVMGASAVNGSFAERSSYSGYGCNIGEQRVFEDHFFNADDNIIECSGKVGTDTRTSPTASNG
ncbi:MAG TPA: hypothetical protein VD766_06995 [Solirubrobacterales bacterium]|nr:hypothetical protein [Solirubrobacterales bacterium]